MPKLKTRSTVRARMPHETHELPDDIISALNETEEITDEVRLTKLQQTLMERLDEAIKYRAGDGLEDVWMLCEEQYHGIDDLNRHEYNGLKWIKPTVGNAPLISAQTSVINDVRSTAYVRLTSRYVDSAYAKVGEILLPYDDKAFSFTSTPLPQLTEGIHDATPVSDHGLPLLRDADASEVPAGQQAPGAPPPKVPLTVKDLAMEAIELAEEKAKKAERRIWDWMVESHYPREMRKVIHDSARLGVGVLKGPYPVARKQMALVKENQPQEERSPGPQLHTTTPNFILKINEEIVPEMAWRDPWNIFPDPGCGEYIQNGEWCFERDFASRKEVKALAKLPGYMARKIDQVLSKDPGHTTNRFKGRNPQDRESKNQFQYEIWYFVGVISRADLRAANPKTEQRLSDRETTTGRQKSEDVFAVVTMIEDVVVKATLNPLESGELPYLNIPWTRRTGSWAGVGIAEQIRVPQRIVNAATRAMLNNAGVSSGGQIIIDKAAVTPGNGQWTVTPNKIWYKSADGQTDDVRKAFYTFNIESRVDDLMKIIEYGMRLAEESTNIPLITQGMSGATSPDTFGATQLQNNNANQLLRSIGYSFDDHITTPLIKMMYEWLLLDEDTPADEKGDFKIHSHGSIALVERAIQDQTIAQMTTIAENPIFGVNPKKWFAQLAKSKKLNPKDFQYTEEEQAKIDSQPQAPPPAVQVAQIKAQIEQMKVQAAQQLAQQDAQLEMQIAQLEAETKKVVEQARNETAQLKVKMDTDRDTVYVNAQTEKIRTDYDGKMREIAAKKELLAMEMAANHQITVEQAKTKLADTAMKLKVQKELSAAELAVDMHTRRQGAVAKDVLRPPVQTPGRAKKGKAFSQS